MYKLEEWQGTYRNVWISSFPLGISGREDGVHKHKGPYDLGAQSNASAVPSWERVGPTTILYIIGTLKGLDERNTTNGSQALSYHVQHGPNQRHLTSQEEPESHCWVNMTPYVQKQVNKLASNSQGNRLKILYLTYMKGLRDSY